MTRYPLPRESTRSRIIYFRLFDAAGNLTALTPVELLYLTDRTRDALDACDNMLWEHGRRRPSTFWFLVSFLSGLGSLFFLEPDIGSIIITVGGALGAIKSLYDLSMHLGLEQRYLRLYWGIARRKNALEAELRRRGMI